MMTVAQTPADLETKIKEYSYSSRRK
jgi:hypothetical protein